VEGEAEKLKNNCNFILNLYKMEATQVRKQLHDYIDNSNDNVVEALLSFLKAKNEDIFTDESVDLDEYNADIENAMKEIDKGNFYTENEVESIIKKRYEKTNLV
jgi:predicted transcriptional regulator